MQTIVMKSRKIPVDFFVIYVTAHVYACAAPLITDLVAFVSLKFRLEARPAV